MTASRTPLRPRKKPLQPRALETVSALLEAAAQILEARGPAGFNTNAVAERAGVSIGSLYQYFPGKDALLIALMRREKERFRDDAAAALEAASGRAAIEHLIAAAARHQLDRPELARLLDIEETRPEARGEVLGITGFVRGLRVALDRDDLPRQPDRDVAADDVATIIRALTDAAGARGETDHAALESRLRATVFAYFESAASADDSPRM